MQLMDYEIYLLGKELRGSVIFQQDGQRTMYMEMTRHMSFCGIKGNILYSVS